MGNIANKCFEAFDKNRIFDINREDEDSNNLNKDKNSNSNKNKYHKKNFYNINDILVPAKTIINNNNDRNNNINPNDEDSVDISKVIKIQNSYHKRYLKKKFETDIKPSLSQKTAEYINNIHTFLSSQGDVSKNMEEFSPNNWTRFYPSNDRFFLYDKGNVFPNQIRINNQEDLNNIEIYEGEVNMKNMKHGNGILTNPHYVLKGSWRNDEFTGWGIKCLRNGETFEGKFINGELNGKGIFKNGKNIYEGDFVNNQRYGKGDLTTEKYHYKGEFKNNKLEGQGVIDFFEGGQRYEGTFSGNNINGKGTYKWKNGDIYIGDVKDGKLDGFGKFIFSDGKIYEGEYRNDIREGKGKLTIPDGKSYEGNFVNGELDGEVIYNENNKIKKIIYSNGQFVKYL